MSLSEILGSAVSGLVASQAGLRTVSNNIANVGTPGYARERIALAAGVTAGRVTGVITGEPQRIADRFLEANAYRRASDVGHSEISANYQDRLQALLGAPGSEAGLPARLNAIAAGAVAMSASQASAQTRAAFAGDVEDAVNSMQQLDIDVGGLRADADAEVTTDVETVNALLTRIHDLNDTVARQTGLGQNATGAFGQRLSALDELSGLLKVSIRDQPDGRVSIDTAAGGVLLDKRLRLLSYPTGGTGTAQPVYPRIDIRFANPDGSPGASTGEQLDSAVVGGRIGALLDLRDHVLPVFSEKLGTLFAGIAEAINAASNTGSAVPAPQQLAGRPTGLVGSDRLGFSGAAVFAVVGADGTLLARTSLDLAALGPAATVDDAVAAINTGLGGTATASFAGGKLVLTATAPGTGVATAQVPGNPSDRGGSGFAQFFGLNDLVESPDSLLVPPGFTAADPHGFAAGQTAELVLRDSNGRLLGSHTLTGSAGASFGDLVTELNSGNLGSFGSFAIDSRGRFAFTANTAVVGPALAFSADLTDRFGTGRSFSSLSGLTGLASGLANAQVRPRILADPTLLPLARLETGVAIGSKALGAGDLRGALDFGNQLARAIDLGKDGTITTGALALSLIGQAGSASSRATDALADAAQRRDDAVNRRDNFSGVNIDEELAQMVVLQNSYSAAARVISTASEMYDTLIAMIR